MDTLLMHSYTPTHSCTHILTYIHSMMLCDAYMHIHIEATLVNIDALIDIDALLHRRSHTITHTLTH